MKITTKLGLPEIFLERLAKIVPENSFASILQTFSKRKPTTFRTNTLKITTEKLEEELIKNTISFEKIPWYPDAFILKNSTQKELTDTILYKDGLIYLQSLSSMIPPLVLDPKPDELILDIAASPGSKTTQIAAMMNNTGTIVANDKSRIRQYKLEANLQTLGVTNTKTTYMPGQMIWKKYPEYFDKTLVDVPCTLEGRFYTQDSKTYQDWSTGKIKELVQIQRFLLRSAISATKPGGTIVYSTCTLEPEENEGIIDWILKREKGAVVLEEIILDTPDKTPAILSWNKKNFNPEITKTARILPSEKMEAFYIAKLKKVASTVYFYA